MSVHNPAIQPRGPWIDDPCPISSDVFPSLESVAAMPVWMAGAIAALIVVACLLAFNRSGRERMLGGRSVLFSLASASSGYSSTVRRAAIWRSNAAHWMRRANELMVRAVMPGSALACLDAHGRRDGRGLVREGAVCNAGSDGRRCVLRRSATHAVGRCRRVSRRRDSSYHGRTGAAASFRGARSIRHRGARAGGTRRLHAPTNAATFALLNDASRVSANLAEQRV